MKKRSVMLRVPQEYDDLISNWQRQANKAGYPDTKSDIQRKITRKLKPYHYRPDIGEFKVKDLYDVVHPLKKRKRDK